MTTKKDATEPHGPMTSYTFNKLHTAVSRDTQIMYLNVLHNMEMVNGTVISEHILKQPSQE